MTKQIRGLIKYAADNELTMNLVIDGKRLRWVKKRVNGKLVDVPDISKPILEAWERGET